ncbi:MAG: hypothetical protein QF724_01540 [Planctomycetota bacterium]|nr:hypothetical protein [Planctomycetota bacterium]
MESVTQEPTPLALAHAPPLPARARAAGEVLRALGGGLLLPTRSLAFALSRRRRLAQFSALLGRPRDPDPVPALPSAAPFLQRPLRVFLSCAEASGEGHTLRLLEALRERLAAAGAPAPQVLGLGGPPLAEAGAEVLADPVERATMGLSGVAASLSFYTDLLAKAEHCFADWRPDIFLPVDSPALHIPMARAARRQGVPVMHHVTPQLWAWAPWRLGAYRRAVNLATSILPFEPDWFAAQGVTVAHVGHPLADELAKLPKTQEAPREGAPLALLPGSRRSVIERNLPWMLEVLRARAAADKPLPSDNPLPPLEILSDDQANRPLLESIVQAQPPSELSIRILCGDLHANLARARAACSVSGTILLDLLHHRLPTVVLYRLGTAREEWLYRHALSTPFFSSVNLLAGEALLPEFCFHGEGPREAVRAALERALYDDKWRADCAAGLGRAAANLGGPGAAQRAAGHALALAAGGSDGA